MFRDLISRMAIDPSIGGLAASATILLSALTVSGWGWVETYRRGVRDGRREMAGRKPVIEPWDDLEGDHHGQC